MAQLNAALAAIFLWAAGAFPEGSTPANLCYVALGAALAQALAAAIDGDY